MIIPINNIGIRGHIRSNNNVSNNKSKINCVSENALLEGGISFSANPSIMRFKQIDETLYRGARPNLEQLFNLKDIGISKIIDFSVEPTRVDGYSESLAAKNIGMEYYRLPFVSWENPTEEYINKFFEIVQDAKNKNQKVFIHCLEGKDRTGLFSELYRIKYGLSTPEESINDLIKGRYNFSENPCARNLIKDFAESIKKQ